MGISTLILENGKIVQEQMDVISPNGYEIEKTVFREILPVAWIILSPKI